MESETRFVLKALQGKTVVVTDTAVKIEKEGGFFAAKREKTIPLQQITSIEVKAPSTFVGFIQFSLAGAAAHNSGYTISGGAFDAAGDENAATFTSQDAYATALKIKDFLNERQQARSSPGGAGSDPAAALATYASLLEKGLMTREEFDAAKRKLLGL